MFVKGLDLGKKGAVEEEEKMGEMKMEVNGKRRCLVDGMIFSPDVIAMVSVT